MIQRSANPGEQNKSFSLIDETVLDAPEKVRVNENVVIDFRELAFSTQEVSDFEYTFLRNLAAAAPTEEINGKSNRLLIEKYHGVQRSLSDFED